jgi:hypothetical protein
MSKNTEASYLDHILDYIRFNNKRHPAQMGIDEIVKYLSHRGHRAIEKEVAASTQNPALSALLFLPNSYPASYGPGNGGAQYAGPNLQPLYSPT